jgi:hypothetical protein
MTEEARFALRIDADGEPAAAAAAELEKFRASIEKSQSAIANYRKSMGLLKGSSAEVADAKAQLKAAIAAETAVVTKANLGILKLGGSYDKLSKAERKAKGESDGIKKAVSAIGGPVKEASSRFGEMKEILASITSGWALLGVSMAATVAVIAISAAAIAGLELKLADFVLHTADANRNLQLTREAFSGSEKNATAWGHVIDWASEKTALTTDKLNGLAIAVEKADRGTRISGAGMVHEFNALAAAAGAGRDDTVAAMQDIIERGKLTGRTFIGWKAPGISELAGKGIDAAAVFKELGLTAAQSARGVVVSTDRMAAALDKVATAKFADINAKKALSLGFQWDRLSDNVMKFTNDLIGTGGALEPLLKDVKSLADTFDLSTQSGQDMKTSVTQYGIAAAAAFHASLPTLKSIVVEGAHLVGVFIDVSTAVIAFSQSSLGMILIKGVLIGIAVVVGSLVVAFAAVALVVGGLIYTVGQFFSGIWAGAKAILALDWSSIGLAIVDGINKGIAAGWNALKATVSGMASGIKKTFEGALGIQSPSRVFMMYGQQTGAGYQKGVEASSPRVQAATADMAGAATDGGAQASAPASSGGGSAGGSTSVTVQFYITGHDAEGVKHELESSSVLDSLQRTIRAALRGAGVPTGIPQASGG